MRNRNMYNLTGLPGWMRFGYSPGWVGRSSSGLGPCAEYLLQGQWPNPQMAAAWQAQAATVAPGAAAVPPTEAQLGFLRQQAERLEQQLQQIKSRIAALESPEE